MKKVARILSIDGGGIRGIIPASLIASWESKLGPIAQKFHMVAGTSTGGILACALSQGVSAKNIIEFYKKDGPSIFESSIFSLGGLSDVMYPAENLESAIKKVIKGNLSDIQNDLLITTYDIEKNSPYFFKSWKARGYEVIPPEKSISNDFELLSVARGTSAAPTYFEPARVQNAEKKFFTMVDGGVYANNPAMCAYVAAKRIYPNADEYLVVSLGTGLLSKHLSYDEVKSFGLIGWARPLLDIMFSGSSDTVDYQLDQLYPTVSHFRFQTSLEGASEAMDNATPENLHNLIKCADKTRKSKVVMMTNLVSRLREPMTPKELMGYPKKGMVSKAVEVAKKVEKKIEDTVTQTTESVITLPVATGTGGAVLGGLLGGPVGMVLGGVAGYFGGKKVG